MAYREGAMLKILVVEDHTLVRDGLLVALRGLDVETQAFGVAEANGAIAVLDSEDIDLMILDLMLPGIQGDAFLPIVRRRFPTVPVVILSALDDVETVSRVMKAGASGFVSKSSSSTELVSALQKVMSGEIYLPPEMSSRIARNENGDAGASPLTKRFGLTPAQGRVLEQMAEGSSNRQIAEVLGLSVGTVKIHVSKIMKTLGVSNRAAAALMVKRKQRRQGATT
jgi:DNA-binding NarL/FixJ family response regulator